MAGTRRPVFGPIADSKKTVATFGPAPRPRSGPMQDDAADQHEFRNQPPTQTIHFFRKLLKEEHIKDHSIQLLSKHQQRLKHKRCLDFRSTASLNL
ncbi:hypothetical protein ACVFVO_18420 [Advenella kashmirensis]